MKQSIPEAVLRALRPRRSIAGTFSGPGKKPIEALRKKLTTGRFVYKDAVRRGVEAETSPELAALRRAAYAPLADLSLETLQAANVEALAGFVCLVRTISHDLHIVPALLQARGLADVVEIVTLSLGFSVNSPGNWTQEIHLQRGRSKRAMGSFDWLPVRNAVCASSDVDYAAAKQRALELAKGADSQARVHLAFAFPDEPWGDAALEAWLGEETTVTFSDGALLLSCCSDAELVKRFVAKLQPFLFAQHAADLAVTLPEADAIELLGAALPALFGAMKTPPRDVATALTYFRTPAAAAVLAKYAGHAIVGAIVAGYFQDNPELGAALKAGASTKAGRAMAERVLASVAGEVETDVSALASDAALPALLCDKPWRKKLGKPSVLRDVTLLEGLPEHVALPPHVRSLEQEADPPRAMTPAEVEAYVAESKAAKGLTADYEHERLPSGKYERILVPAPLALEVWNQGRGWLHAGELALVARHGLAALPGFIEKDSLNGLDYEGAAVQLAAICSFVSPRIAPLIARIAARRKKHRRTALRWLKEHAMTAALGLVPPAVGAPGAERDDAEAALSFLIEAGYASSVHEASLRYGERAAEIIGELAARDPLATQQQPPKFPEFLHPERLPALRLTSGERLPDTAQAALLEMLSISTLDTPYAGLRRLDALDAGTLGGFAFALLEQWLLADSPGRHEWMLHAVVHLPSDESARRLAALARDGARRDKAKAARVCAALAALASDAAFLHLGHIAETSRFNDLRQQVQGLLDEAAAARGLSRDELEDRTVPDLGLGADGKLLVSFGPRQFVASLDAALGLVVKDETGAVLRALPRKTKDDDESLAKAGVERLKALRTDAAAIAARQIQRLERAMVRGRTFAVADFRSRIAGHPVVASLARALVWRAQEPGQPARAFRIAEDGSFASVTDEAFSLGESASVGIVHPLQLGEEARVWASLFADYEIIQPFEQLGREVFACPAAERAASVSGRFAGVVLEATKLMGTLEARDFERSDAGSVSHYARGVAQLWFSPGFEIAYLSEGKSPQTLGELRLSEGTTFGTLEPIVYSELMRDLEALRR